MSKYKMVPVEPTPEMVEAAQEAYMPFGDMDIALRMALLAAPAVQGDAVPEGCALIKLDSRTGKPLVTSEMKAKHIGEYWWDEEAPYYDENGVLHDHVARHAVPWSLCKEIYKSMAKSAMLSAQPAEQQPDATQLVEALEAIVSHHDEYFRDSSTESRMPWIEQARAALDSYRKQGGEK